MRKKLPIVLLLLAFCSLAGSSVFAQAPQSVSPSMHTDVVKGVLYIQLKARHGVDFENLTPKHTGNAELDRFFSEVGVTEIYPFDADAKNYGVSRRNGIDRMYVIHFPEEGFSPRILQQEILKLDAVQNASPRYLFQPCSYTPNDPDIPKQYALDNSHMNLFNAWGVSKGNANIVIADCDEGVNYNHEDIAANIYKLGNFFGYDVVGDNGTATHFKPDNDPMPFTGQNHGTMTSGCFGAVADNGKGGAGSGFNCKIMAIRIADASGLLPGGYEGIHYAVIHGAKIVNCSWAGQIDPPAVPFIEQFIQEATDTGSMVIASSANYGYNNDDSLIAPANIKGVFAVGWTNQNDNADPSSDYGHRVNAYAPGGGIFSTSLPLVNSYDFASGTSFSCPLTAGVAGLVWAKNPDWSPKFVMRQIVETCDNVVKPTDRKHYWGRVNAYSALTKQTIPGLKITDYKVDGIANGGLNFINKQYSIDVNFKNYMAAGSSIQAKLIPVQGIVDPSPTYTIQLGLANLGSMSSQQTTMGSFKFTRDTNDDGAGSQLMLAFAISYGTATLQADKYYDTLFLFLDITGDNIYSVKSVASGYSAIHDLGNSFPNPVSGDAVIHFDLANTGFARLSISDVLGRNTGIFTEGIFDEGPHSVRFDMHGLENGVYFYKLETSDGAAMTKRMIVIH